VRGNIAARSRNLMIKKRIIAEKSPVASDVARDRIYEHAPEC
jgi:hypothetical protein